MHQCPFKIKLKTKLTVSWYARYLPRGTLPRKSSKVGVTNIWRPLTSRIHGCRRIVQFSPWELKYEASVDSRGDDRWFKLRCVCILRCPVAKKNVNMHAKLGNCQSTYVINIYKLQTASWSSEPRCSTIDIYKIRKLGYEYPVTFTPPKKILLGGITQ